MKIRQQASNFEWPTWLLIAFVYLAWAVLVTQYHQISAAPIFLVVILTLHGSMQHEILHGHPTQNQFLNDVFAYPPLALWYPYPNYRQTHLQHHNNSIITLPGIDPESFYVDRTQWQKMSSITKQLMHFNMTLAGRFLIGPGLSLCALAKQCWSSIFTKENHPERITWLLHISLVSALLIVLHTLLKLPAWQYFAIAYCAQSLSLLRSFFEHRAVEDPVQRSVIVEASLPMRLLFTNNNYHLVHHDQPRTAWYLLPHIYRQDRAGYQQRSGDFVVHGYSEWCRRYLFQAVSSPVHPFSHKDRVDNDK